MIKIGKGGGGLSIKRLGSIFIMWLRKEANIIINGLKFYYGERFKEKICLRNKTPQEG